MSLFDKRFQDRFEEFSPLSAPELVILPKTDGLVDRSDLPLRHQRQHHLFYRRCDLADLMATE